MIKALITDFGGVLVRTHTDRARRELERKLNLSPHTIEDRVFNSDLSLRAQHGELLESDFWVETVRDLGADRVYSDPQVFRLEFFSDDFLDQELVDLIRSVRPAIKTGLISNAWSDLRLVLRDTFAIDDLFDVTVISAEEKIMKPDPLIYRRALNRLGVNAAEAIFLDDVHLNVEAARATGMHGVHFHSSEQARRELRALLGQEI